MNIFATSTCPVKSALWLDDVRVNKMILESAQMLSTAIRLCHDSPPKDIYKSAYVNHPCTVWARRTRANFNWLIDHARALAVIFDHNSCKEHKSLSVINLCADNSECIPDGKLTPFANCTPFKSEEDLKHDVCILYRMTMIQKWDNDIKYPTWTNRKQPPWRK